MIPLLAQIPNATPGEIGAWLVAGAAVMAIILMALNIIKHFKPSPPIEEKFSALDERFASKGDHNDLKIRVAQIEINHREDLSKVFQKLETMNTLLSRIDGRLLEQDKRK